MPKEEWGPKFISEWVRRPDKGQLPPMIVFGCKILEKIEETFGRQKVIDGLSSGSVAILRSYNQAATRPGGYRFPENLLDELEKEEEALRSSE